MIHSYERTQDPNYDPVSDPHNGIGKGVPEIPDTTGKVVTLEKGIVVTDIGASPHGHGGIRRVITDTGVVMEIIDRVIHELPVTYRRAEMRGY